MLTMRSRESSLSGDTRGSSLARRNARNISTGCKADHFASFHMEAYGVQVRPHGSPRWAGGVHAPHITMLQRFVKTADLPKVYAAADRVIAKANPTRLLNGYL